MRIASPTLQRCTRTPTHHPRQRRLFSATAVVNNEMTMQRARAMQYSRSRANRSMKQKQQEAIQAQDLEKKAIDIGLVPGSFRKPHWLGRPSWFTQTQERFWFEWTAWRSFIEGYVTILTWKFFIKNWRVKPRPKLEIRLLKPKAQELHKDLYTKLAAGNIAGITEIACKGLVDNLRIHLTSRPAGQTQKWEILSYNDKPRLVADRSCSLPIPNVKECGIRQAIVRLNTQQRLSITNTTYKAAKREFRPTRFQGTSELPAAHRVVQAPERAKEEAVVEELEPVVKNVIEYVVIQQRMWKGKVDDWKIWGFAEESTVEGYKKEAEDAKAYAKAMRKFQEKQKDLGMAT